MLNLICSKWWRWKVGQPSALHSPRVADTKILGRCQCQEGRTGREPEISQKIPNTQQYVENWNLGVSFASCQPWLTPLTVAGNHGRGHWKYIYTCNMYPVYMFDLGGSFHHRIYSFIGDQNLQYPKMLRTASASPTDTNRAEDARHRPFNISDMPEP